MPGHLRICCHPRPVSHGTFSVMARPCCGAEAGIFRDQLPVILFGVDRFLPPFFGINSYVFPSFLNPQNAVLTQPIVPHRDDVPSEVPVRAAIQSQPGTGNRAGHDSQRRDTLALAAITYPREAEQNPFEPALGHRYNPNLPSPLQTVLTDAQSFYNSFQLSVSKQHANNLSWQVFYTLSHSIDDASNSFLIEAVNEPQSQDIFDRKGSRGRSGFDIRHNFVGNVVYELPFGRGSWFGGWQISGIASVHSNVPFTPVLSFDNADLQSVDDLRKAKPYWKSLLGCLSKRRQSGHSGMLV